MHDEAMTTAALTNVSPPEMPAAISKSTQVAVSDKRTGTLMIDFAKQVFDNSTRTLTSVSQLTQPQENVD